VVGPPAPGQSPTSAGRAAPATGSALPTATGSKSAPAATPGPPQPPTPGWVAVDSNELAADVTAFFARSPKPVTGNPVQVPEFHATCTVSHHGDTDPIVFPRLPGASHNHTFWGNTTTNENTTPASLATATTTCNPAQDRSAYWVPTLYQNGKVVDPVEVTVYYGSRLKVPSRTQPFPFGLRMISGDPKKQSDPQGTQFWCAGIGGAIGRSADGTVPVCAATAHLVRQIMFPDCWDGAPGQPESQGPHGRELSAVPASHPVPIRRYRS
jgi:hypothetical protein